MAGPDLQHFSLPLGEIKIPVPDRTRDGESIKAETEGGMPMRENLKAARKAAGLTQQAMADKLGISLRYYQQIEAGDRTGDFAIWDELEDITGVHQRILRVTNLDKAGNP